MNAPIVDADGHVLEPPDLWVRYVDPAWRARAIRVARSPDGRDSLLVDGRPARSLHRRFDELAWPEAVPFPGAWYLQVMFAQAVQQAFTTFFQYATFDRFPALRLVVLESGAGWLGFWMDRMDGFFRSSLRVTIPLREEPSHYVRRQCWISGDLAHGFARVR